MDTDKMLEKLSSSTYEFDTGSMELTKEDNTTEAVNDLLGGYWKKDDEDTIITQTLGEKLLDKATPEQLELINRVSESMGIPYSDEQKAVILHDGAPLNIVSCAGSGKTAVLIARQLYRVIQYGIKPYQMLSVTFNANAKVEIEERYNKGKRGLNILGTPDFRTFHGLFLMLITQLDKYRDIEVMSEGKYNFQLLKLVSKSSTEDSTEVLQAMFRLRSYLINNSLSIDGIENSEVKSNLFTIDNYRQVMTRYEELKKQNGEVDFDDMLVLLHQELHSGDTELIDKFQSVYKDIYIDEYQDISRIQIEIMDKLIKDVNRLTAIGDDDQSIYGFRGSEPKYIVDFIYHYPNADRLYLSTNYRCTRNILDAVKPSIEKNTMRVEKEINAHNDGGELFILPSSNYQKLADKVYEDTEGMYGNMYDDMAILVRTNAQRMLLGDALASRGVQVDIGNINFTLRNNRIYKTIMGILYAIKDEDNDLFATYYRPLLPMLNSNVVKSYKGDTTKNWYKDYIEDGNGHIPNEVRNIILSIKNAQRMDNIIGFVWKGVNNYYQELSKKGYGSITRVMEVFKYLFSISKEKSIDEFMKLEGIKEGYLQMYCNSGNAIEIKTVHTVKGLEYDTVYLVGVDSTVFPSQTMIDTFKTELSHATTVEKRKEIQGRLDGYIEEERRLFYVGFTRAKTKLYLHYNPTEPSMFIPEIDTSKAIYLEEG